MLKRHKDLLRTLVGKLRDDLAGRYDEGGVWQPGDLDRELERLGIGLDGAIAPRDQAPNPTPAERRARRVAEAQLEPLPPQERAAARAALVERAAYTWINRLLALRAMEARELIGETLRANPAYEGLSEALFILRQTSPQRTAGPDAGWWAVVEDACAEQAAALPGLFDLADPAAALRPSTAALLRAVALVGGAVNGFSLEEADAAFADPDAVGWAYQFYQEAAKARVYAKLGSGGKAASRAEIAAVTQLFTEPYMVKWLLQNSLGRTYHELYPASALPATWEYYVRTEDGGRKTDERETGLPSPSGRGTGGEGYGPSSLASLTVLDPCMGSGHFLREAFDMLAAMHREQHPDWSAVQVAETVLAEHLHGIDIDPRAAQLAALTLYLRAWEFVRDGGRRTEDGQGHSSSVLPSSSVLRPPSFRMNLATTPSGLTPGALARHLQRHPEDRLFKPVLEGVFAALEQADILGSLLRPGERLDEAIAGLRQSHTLPLDLDPDERALRQTITALAQDNPAELKRLLLGRIEQSFAAEAQDSDDVAAALFGREAEQGVRLLHLLDQRYAVVVTNPPYMGSKNMDASLRKYIEERYNPGKRDLYAAFILRCLEFCLKGGRVAMVTQHSWMFLGAFDGIRQGLVSGDSISAIAHLGTKTFKELSNTNALGFTLFTIDRVSANARRIVPCLRLVHAELKEAALLTAIQLFNKGLIGVQFGTYRTSIIVFQKIPGNVFFYWAPPKIEQAFLASRTLSQFLEARQGLITGDNLRFLRFWWEVVDNRWKPYSKGGPYRRWFGNYDLVVDWGYDGIRIKDLKAPSGRSKSRPQNISYYFREGGTWTGQSSYGFSVRYMPEGFIFDAKGPAFFVKPNAGGLLGLIAIANSKLVQFVFSAIQPTVDYGEGYFMSLPAPSGSAWMQVLPSTGSIAAALKQRQITEVLTERSFDVYALAGALLPHLELQVNALDALIHSVEGFNERVTDEAYELDISDIEAVISEAGTPAGWYALIAGYDALPPLPDDLDLPPLPQEVLDYLAQHRRVQPDRRELTRLKANLRALYEAGPGAKDVEQDEGEAGDDDDEGEAVAGAYIPIPTETFLEELSVKLETHPVSVYWLLEELRREGARCKPEELRLLEDHLNVLVLRLLGHRWPRQVEAGEAVPAWADADGIIPLTAGTGEPALAERLRGRLRAEDGELGAQRTEALLAELTGYTLEEWLRRAFFPRHVRQFKSRPVAWRLASAPPTGGKRKGARRPPAFECLLYYHRAGRDALARLRTQYLEPLLLAERRRLEEARGAKDDTAAALAGERIQELEDFAQRLRGVEEEGFACPELDKLAAAEPLDRWSGDGTIAPPSRDAFLGQERAWAVDINDGVRVNIAPLQLAGLVAADVLRPADARKAVADRARWRADERRWTREGKLPRPGWLDDGVPESEAWRTLAPQREAEQFRLAQKRQALARQGS